MASLSEDNLLWLIKVVLFIIPLLNCLLEFSLFTNVRELAFYHFVKTGNVNGSGRIEVGSLVMIAITFLAALILHLRIELDHSHYEEDAGLMYFIRQCFAFCNDVGSAESQSWPYKINIFRLLFGSAIFLVGLFVYHASVGTGDLRYNFQVFYVILYCFCPWVFVLNHCTMKATAFRLLLCRLHFTPNAFYVNFPPQ